VQAITKHQAVQAVNKYESLKRRVAGMREHANRATQQAVRTAEVGGTAFLLGLVQGRTDGIEILGVPLEAAVAATALRFSLLGGAGDSSHHIAAVGDGATAAYLNTLGRGVGVTMRQKALGTGGGGAATTSVVTKGTTLTPEEVAALSNG